MPTHHLKPKAGKPEIEEDNNICFFGQTNYRNQMRTFGMKLDDRRRHTYVIGKTGMGKTTLMENMVLHDIYNGNGIGIVDPHGDFSEKILDYIPSHRINDVVYVNPSDVDFPVGFNILEVSDPAQKHLVAQGLMATFKKIWPDTWSSRMEYILNNTLLALLDYPGSTLLGINRLLGDKKYRKKVVAKLTDPVIKAFWEQEFAQYNDRYASEAVAPIQNKIGQFLSASVIRNMVAQVKSTIDIRSAMDSKKILIMNLSKGRIGEDNSRLLGGMLITKIQLSAMERVDTLEVDRKDFFLYVDEFQNFATPSFANILSEARKYRLGLIMAHQYVAQLDEIVADAVFGNVGTLITFRVGAADAEFLAKEFMPTFTEEDIINLPKFQIFLKLMIDGVSSSPFSASSLPPIGQVTGSREKVIRNSRERYANPRSVIEDKINRWSAGDGDEVVSATKEITPKPESTPNTNDKIIEGNLVEADKKTDDKPEEKKEEVVKKEYKREDSKKETKREDKREEKPEERKEYQPKDNQDKREYKKEDKRENKISDRDKNSSQADKNKFDNSQSDDKNKSSNYKSDNNRNNNYSKSQSSGLSLTDLSSREKVVKKDSRQNNNQNQNSKITNDLVSTANVSNSNFSYKDKTQDEKQNQSSVLSLNDLSSRNDINKKSSVHDNRITNDLVSTANISDRENKSDNNKDNNKKSEEELRAKQIKDLQDLLVKADKKAVPDNINNIVTNNISNHVTNHVTNNDLQKKQEVSKEVSEEVRRSRLEKEKLFENLNVIGTGTNNIKEITNNYQKESTENIKNIDNVDNSKTQKLTLADLLETKKETREEKNEEKKEVRNELTSEDKLVDACPERIVEDDNIKQIEDVHLATEEVETEAKTEIKKEESKAEEPKRKRRRRGKRGGRGRSGLISNSSQVVENKPENKTEQNQETKQEVKPQQKTDLAKPVKQVISPDQVITFDN